MGTYCFNILIDETNNRIRISLCSYRFITSLISGYHEKPIANNHRSIKTEWEDRSIGLNQPEGFYYEVPEQRPRQTLGDLTPSSGVGVTDRMGLDGTTVPPNVFVFNSHYYSIIDFGTSSYINEFGPKYRTKKWIKDSHNIRSKTLSRRKDPRNRADPYKLTKNIGKGVPIKTRHLPS